MKVKNPIFKVRLMFENHLVLMYKGRFNSLDEAIVYYRRMHPNSKIIEVKQMGVRI